MECFEEKFGKTVVLKLLRTIYGLKQMARMFWKLLLIAMRSMGFDKSKADSCLYWKRTENGLVIWLPWIDDCLCVGHEVEVQQARVEMLRRFECDDIGEVEEYLVCKVERCRERRQVRLTQTVILLSYNDEFDLPPAGRLSNTPALAGSVLSPEAGEEELVDKKNHNSYRTGVEKLLHVTRWSRPETWNTVRELTRAVTGPSMMHYNAMLRLMKYCVDTPKKGWMLKPKRTWDGKSKFMFQISGRSDSDYVKCPATKRSVSGFNVKLEGAVIICENDMQKTTTLSVTEVETVSGVSCAQEMMYAKNIVESIGLEVELLIILEVDNRGTKYMAQNFASSGRTKHMEIRMLW